MSAPSIEEIAKQVGVDFVNAATSGEGNQKKEGSNNVEPSGGGAATPSNTTTTQWEEGYQLWQNVEMKTKMSQWDEMFGQIVSYKEQHLTERSKLVGYVKEFTSSYKEEPKTEKVEELLKFMKRFINGLYERISVSEKGYLNIYQSFSPAPDPAPLFLSAHVEISAQHRKNVQLSSKLEETRILVDDLKRQLQRSVEEGASAAAAGVADAETMIEVKAMESTMAGLRDQLAQYARQEDASRAEMTRLSISAKQAQDAHLKLTQELENKNATHDEQVGQLEAEILDLTDELAATKHQLRLQRDLGAAAASGNDEVSPRRGGEDEVEKTQLMRELEGETKRRIGAETTISQLQHQVSALESQVSTLRVPTANPPPPPTVSAESTGSEQQQAAPTTATATSNNTTAVLQERKKTRALQFENENLRSQMQEAETAAAETITNLRQQVEHLQLLSAAAGRSERLEAAAGKQEQQLGGVGESEDDLNAVLLWVRSAALGDSSKANEGAEEKMPEELPTTATNQVATAAVGDDMTAALVMQRNHLKNKLDASETTIVKMRSDLIALNTKYDAVLIKLQQLQQSDSGGGVGEGTVAVNIDGKASNSQTASVYQSVADWQRQQVASSKNSASPTTTASGSPAAGKKSKREQALSIVDHVALVMSYMIVKSSTLRTFLVLYILSLHCLLFGTMYYTSANYFHHSTVLKTNPKGGHSGSVHGFIGQGQE